MTNYFKPTYGPYGSSGPTCIGCSSDSSAPYSPSAPYGPSAPYSPSGLSGPSLYEEYMRLCIEKMKRENAHRQSDREYCMENARKNQAALDRARAVGCLPTWAV